MKTGLVGAHHPTALYDFRVAPLTYDFITFLAITKVFFAARGVSNFKLILYRPFFRNVSVYEQDVNSNRQCEARFLNIVMQGTMLSKIAPSVNTICVEYLDDVSDVNFPPAYDVRNVDLSAGISQMPCNYSQLESLLNPNLSPLLYFRTSPRADRRLITLSLRMSDQKPEIKSNLRDWYDLYSWLRARGYTVVVIPDHDDYFGKRYYTSYDWQVDERASHDMGRRLALYGSAFTNVAAPAGWNVYLHYSEFPFICPGYLLDGNPTVLQMMARKGPVPFRQPSWFRNTQQLGWQRIDQLTNGGLVSIVEEHLKDLTELEQSQS